MSIVQQLSVLALRQLVGGTCQALGLPGGEAAAEGAQRFLSSRFTDQSRKLTQALANAQQHAWKALELALAGDSWWDQARAVLAHGDEKALARQIQAFLAACPLSELQGQAALRQRCLNDLRNARRHAVLQGQPDCSGALRQAAGFARFQEPQQVLDLEWRALARIAIELEGAQFAALGWLLQQRPAQGPPLLILLVGYFFRREVETDAELFRGLTWDRLAKIDQAQQAGFAALGAALTQHGDRIASLLADVRTAALEARDGVRRVEAELQNQRPQLAKINSVDEKVARLELVVAQLPQQLQQLGQEVQKVLVAKQMSKRVVAARDSLSLRSDGERRLVQALVQEYRALPSDQRDRVPTLLNAIGKLEVLAGDLDHAREDFQKVTRLVTDPKVQAEAHYNAYQAALERGDWQEALRSLLAAVRLDAPRFAPFPVGKYVPERILGAGGFGVAFLCRHQYMDGPVVVKTLRANDLQRGADQVFTEGQALRRLDHPSIVRIQDCGYVDAAHRSRPYFVMDYFEGQTLEALVAKHGPLGTSDLLGVAVPMAEALGAAHHGGILHRDVKPANLLVLRQADSSGSTWQVKVIDFGLALRHEVVQSTMQAVRSTRQTVLGVSIAGTIDYAAPEQMGRRPGTEVGPRSDIYGFGKTCCYALFGTPQPSFQHWRQVPEGLAEFLGRCIMDDPNQRPTDFGEVLSVLQSLRNARRSSTKPRAAAPMPEPSGASLPLAIPLRAPIQQTMEVPRALPVARVTSGTGVSEVASPRNAPISVTGPEQDATRAVRLRIVFPGNSWAFMNNCRYRVLIDQESVGEVDSYHPFVVEAVTTVGKHKLVLRRSWIEWKTIPFQILQPGSCELQISPALNGIAEIRHSPG